MFKKKTEFIAKNLIKHSPSVVRITNYPDINRFKVKAGVDPYLDFMGYIVDNVEIDNKEKEEKM